MVAAGKEVKIAWEGKEALVFAVSLLVSP